MLVLGVAVVFIPEDINVPAAPAELIWEALEAAVMAGLGTVVMLCAADVVVAIATAEETNVAGPAFTHGATTH